uniref:Ig-like domain-containing protein n=1 Tax=Ditylenchus dipsaci TaxID=166011 RepID=A0A915E316_9BILA
MVRSDEETGIHKLVIHNASPDDQGDITVKVKNKAGEDQSRGHLAVEVEEFIAQNSQKDEGCQCEGRGDSHLEVVVTGHQSLRFNGSGQLQPDCQAGNNVMQEATLVKLSTRLERLKPRLNLGYHDVVVWRATGTSRQWFKNGEPIQLDNARLITKSEGNGKHSLTVKEASLEDAGVYSCKAVNKAGEAVTKANLEWSN